MVRPLGLTRVTVVEDHQLFAETLDLALTLEGHAVRRVPIEGPRIHSRQLLAAILRTRPGVVLLDLDLGQQTSGLRLIAPLHRAGIAVVVVTGCDDEVRWGECLWYGARTVLPKTSPLNTILATIRRIGENRTVIDRAESERLRGRFRLEASAVQKIRLRLETLTPREAQVLAALMNGRHVPEIARDAFVSEATVRTQVKSILAKLEVSSQLAAVGAAHRAEWHQTHQACPV